MPDYAPNDAVLNDPNIQFLMGKLNPAIPKLAPQYTVPTTQPTPSPWVPPDPSVDIPADAVPPMNAAPNTPANIVAPAPVNQDMGGLIPTRDTNNPHVVKEAQLGAQIAQAQRDKNLNPRWWERLIAGLSTGAQAYANGGHATPAMMEMAENINNRRRNAVIDPLQTEYSTEADQANKWNTAEDQNYRSRHDAWEGQMAVSKDRIAQQREDAMENRNAAMDKFNQRKQDAKEAADNAKEDNANRRADQMDHRLDIMEQNSRGDKQPKFSAMETLKLHAAARRLGKNVEDMDDNEIRDAISGEKGSRAVATFRDAQSIDKYSSDMYTKKRNEVRLEKQTETQLAKATDAAPEEIKAKLKAIEDNYNQWAQGFESQKKSWYDRVGKGKSVSADDNGQEVKDEAPVAAKSGSSPKVSVGQQVVVGGKTYTVKSINPKTGKPVLGE